MSRSHETRIVIDAPIEEVWKAIAEAAGLARWFAPEMTVEPGAGGSMLAGARASPGKPSSKSGSRTATFAWRRRATT
jgi:uncharacterized protein YndB with AHSA1/START domain